MNCGRSYSSSYSYPYSTPDLVIPRTRVVTGLRAGGLATNLIRKLGELLDSGECYLPTDPTAGPADLWRVMPARSK